MKYIKLHNGRLINLGAIEAIIDKINAYTPNEIWDIVAVGGTHSYIMFTGTKEECQKYKDELYKSLNEYNTKSTGRKV